MGDSEAGPEDIIEMKKEKYGKLSSRKLYEKLARSWKLE